MEEVLAALIAQQDELNTVLDGLAIADWHRQSRCDEWDLADVVLHLAQTNEMAVASARDRFAEALAELTGGAGPAGSVDDGAAAMVARDRAAGPEAIAARWRASTDALQAALRAREPSDRVVWVAGELSARTLATTRLAETWIHTGDIAHGLGVELAPTDRLWHIARLAWRTVPYALARAGHELHGPVAFELLAPSGERWDFRHDGPATTTVRGDAGELCLVAGQRVDASTTGLTSEGPDGEPVLALVRTYA